VFLIHVDQNLGKACAKKVETKEGGERDEGEKVAVVASSNTIVQPDTMMVLSFNAVVAYSAMMTSWWTPDVTSLAVLSGYFHRSSLRLSRLDHGPVIHRRGQSKKVFILFRRGHWVEIAG
jgi:hypothetical protein